MQASYDLLRSPHMRLGYSLDTAVALLQKVNKGAAPGTALRHRACGMITEASGTCGASRNEDSIL